MIKCSEIDLSCNRSVDDNVISPLFLDKAISDTCHLLLSLKHVVLSIASPFLGVAEMMRSMTDLSKIRVGKRTALFIL